MIVSRTAASCLALTFGLTAVFVACGDVASRSGEVSGLTPAVQAGPEYQAYEQIFGIDAAVSPSSSAATRGDEPTPAETLSQAGATFSSYEEVLGIDWCATLGEGWTLSLGPAGSIPDEAPHRAGPAFSSYEQIFASSDAVAAAEELPAATMTAKR